MDNFNGIILILVTITIGYAANEFFADDDYTIAYDNHLAPLDVNDLIQQEADTFLNAKTDTSEQRMSNLKEADTRYQRMNNLTKDAQLWNKKMVKDSTSNIKKEYAQALGDYTNLKYDYYNEMEVGIQLEINGDVTGAQTHYQNAKNLQPQIQKQENLLNTIANKDPGFKQYADKEIAQFNQFAEQKKETSGLMNFQSGGPDY